MCKKKYKNKVKKLNTRKQEICASTKTKEQDIKAQLDKAHGKWIKHFNQNHSDAVENIEIASKSSVLLWQF